MNELLNIINRQKKTGIYQLSLDISYEELLILSQENNYKLFYINGENIVNKQDFFECCKEVMNLPEYFGNNWDAWEECITDLSWFQTSSYLLFYKQSQNFASNYPQDWAILLDILQNTISYWQQKNVAFYVILENGDRLFRK